MSNTNEEKAIASVSTVAGLQKRLSSARAVLIDEYRQGFGPGVLDFDNQRLIGDNGILQWSTRQYPGRPESYYNQQTSRGCVLFLKGAAV